MTAKFRIRGRKELFKALDPAKVEAAIRANIRRANTLNGHMAEREIRKTIQAGVRPRTAPLTQAIKGDEKALVDTALLFSSVTSKVTSDVEVFAGVLRTHEAFNIAVITHDGATVRVTPEMRGLFFSLWKASIGEMSASELSDRGQELFAKYQGWKPLKASTAAIIIPARKWVDKTWKRSKMRKQSEKNWTKALELAFKQLTAQTRKR